MPLPTSIRPDDPVNPQRGTDFEQALAVGGASFPVVLRAFMDAYIDYVKKMRRVPSIPFQLVSGEQPLSEELWIAFENYVQKHGAGPLPPLEIVAKR